MKKMIARACAIVVACTALYAPGAFALSFNFADAKKPPASECLSAESPANSGFGQTACPGINPGNDEPLNRARAWVWDNTLLADAASGLFGGIAGDSTDKHYYIDPATLCVTVSGSSYVQAFPADAASGLSFDETICQYSTRTPSKTLPGTMLLMGIGLLGLSSLKKRSPQSLPYAGEAVRSEGSSLLSARLNAAEPRAAHAAATVIPMRFLSRKELPLRAAQRYPAVNKRPHGLKRYQPVRKLRHASFRKEMVG